MEKETEEVVEIDNQNVKVASLLDKNDVLILLNEAKKLAVYYASRSEILEALYNELK